MKPNQNSNNHGLSRIIPEDVKRQVRQNCGFGCCICGNAFYHYDHYNPEFADAKVHDPNGITLLCANHHDAKTRGRLSSESVSNAAASPYCKSHKHSFGSIEFFDTNVVVQIGSTKYLDPTNIIRIDGIPILSIKQPVDKNSPYLISLLTSDDENSCKIIDNEWFGNSSVWDVTTEGSSIVVREKKGKKILEIEAVPQENFIIKKIAINYKGYRIQTLDIPYQKIGGLTIEKETVLVVINSDDLEVVRIGSSSLDINQINAENAIDLEDGYFTSKLINSEIINSNLTLISKNGLKEVSGNILTGSKINFGIDTIVLSFIKNYNNICKQFDIHKNLDYVDPKLLNELFDQYKYLLVTYKIKQITKAERGIIEVKCKQLFKNMK
jgi:hypothetical protein